VIPVDVLQDMMLLVYGIYLLRGLRWPPIGQPA
jgi:hypothetical protein